MQPCNSSRFALLPERRVRAVAPRPRSRCSTAASSSATASTRSCRPTAASCSASTSTWRGSAAASPSCASPTRMSRDQWLERCRKLIAAFAERGGATDQLVYIQVTRGVALRDHVMPAGIEPTVFMMASAMKPASGEQRHHGVAVHQRARLPLGARRHQEHLAARQRAGAADVGRSRRARDDHVPRRLPDRGGGVNVWVVHEGALLGPPKSEHVLEGHPLRADQGAVRGMRHRLQPAADPRGRRRCRPTRSCSARRPRKSCR